MGRSLGTLGLDGHCVNFFCAFRLHLKGKNFKRMTASLFVSCIAVILPFPVLHACKMSLNLFEELLIDWPCNLLNGTLLTANSFC